MEILVKLLIAHFVADFALQWSAMLSSKSQRKFASPYLYLHGLIHFSLSLLLVFDLSLIPGLLVVSASHVVIDGLKLSFTNEENERKLFFLDQLAHLVIIVVVAHFYSSSPLLIAFQSELFYVHLLAIVFISFPVSICLQKFFSKWTVPESVSESLSGVGVYIGYIERFLIYVAVVTGHWSLVGFLIAAKSVFRFGELSKTDDRKYAEYVLVGTLLSMTSAILAGVMFLKVESLGVW